MSRDPTLETVHEATGSHTPQPLTEVPSARRRGPHLTLRERGQDLIVLAEVPGTRPGDISVEVSRDLLTITGASIQSIPRALTSVSRERFSGTFTETLKLLSEVDVARSTAVLNAGLLTVTLPKIARARRRQIPIRTN